MTAGQVEAYRGYAGLRRFRDDIAQTLVDQDVTSDRSDFRASLRAVELDGLGLVDATVSPLASRRGSGDRGSGSVFLLHATDADGELAHARGVERIAPGRLVVVPGGERFEAGYPRASRVVFAVLTESVVRSRFPHLVGPIRSIELSPFAASLAGMLTHLGTALRAPSTIPGAQTDAAALLSTAITALAREIPGPPGDGALRRAERLQALRAGAGRLIDEHLGDPRLGVPFLASLLHVSARTLHRAYEADGDTVTGVIRSRRLTAGAELLRTTPDPVTVISARLGYGSASRFAADFRARFGYSPQEWRRR